MSPTDPNESGDGDDRGYADALILFGITGDLARRKLFSALYELFVAGALDMPVIGVASSPWSDEELVAHMQTALDATGKPVDPEMFARLAKRMTYVSGDYRERRTFEEIARRVGNRQCTVSYLAIPPSLFDDVASGLASVGLHKQGRLVLEKPFGRDTASATELNQIVHRYYDESRVYRIDHFLGKEAVQNLMVFRFANSILEPVWNRQYIKGVQITLAEDFGVEGRGNFYDNVGAVRDVVQNHLLQVLSVLAMEPPVNESADALRDERVKVLKAIPPIDPTRLVRGQYQGYRDEPGVAAGSNIETYAAVVLEVESWRWAGVPWVIRAGKAMSRTVTEAVVEFVRPPQALFAASRDISPDENRLTFRTKPGVDIVLSLQAKTPGQRMVSEPIELHLQHGRTVGKGAYDRLIGDALKGDQALFARNDGVMEAWRIVGPALAETLPIHPYAVGSWGPGAADQLLPEDWSWLTID
jgi:glucose-6-phosphate 1-dehydrogenase